MKYANIVLNATTATILSLTGNLKISEQETNFKSSAIKFNKLTQKIEEILTIDLKNSNIENIRAIVNEYDNLNVSENNCINVYVQEKENEFIYLMSKYK